MESLFGRYKNALVLMLVLLAQVVLLAMQVRRPAPDMPEGHNVRLWRYLVTSVVTPPERLAHSIGKSVRDVWSNYVYLRNLREQNTSLKQENDRLRIEQASLAEDAVQGRRLREMLDFRGRYIDKTVAAQVIGTSGTDQARDIFIDRGSKDGLQVQMPVITPDGIVGKVKNVFPHTAQVLLISDQTSGTGVLLETTRVRGVMKGDASGQPQMINISPDERIKPGEPVITSGGDQVYPPGMPVGVVDRVAPDPDSSYVNVVVKPNANLAALEEVLVVVQFSDKMPFAQEKDLSQSEAVAVAAKQRAADVLSEKLPSIRDPNAPVPIPGATEDAAKAESGGGDPARPMRPPQPLHPDRYSPGAAPPAEDLTPGVAPPGSHRTPSTEASAPVTTPGPKSSASAAIPSNAGSASAPVSRFPTKPGAVTTKTETTSASAGPASGSPPSVGNSGSAKPSAASSTGVVAGQTHTTPSAAIGQPPTVSPARKNPIPLDGESGGILTPAGMGTVGAAPRPKSPSPAGAANSTGATNAASGTATSTTTQPKPVTPKPQAPKPQTPSGTQTNPAPADHTSPPPQPATTPPGGA
jgi:rod shape-determining protein MreC